MNFADGLGRRQNEGCGRCLLVAMSAGSVATHKNQGGGGRVGRLADGGIRNPGPTVQVIIYLTAS